MHIAQINIARLRFPPNDSRVAEFIDNIERINPLAERSPGFVWRLIDDGRNTHGSAVFGDRLLLVNMSVWGSLEALQAFVYKTVHRRFVDQRTDWFRPLGGPHMALWWLPVGVTPSAIEGRERLDHLEAHGPTALAFTFRDAFDPPMASAERTSDLQPPAGP